MPARSLPSSCPAAPTNGTPCLSSWNPGASPTNIRSAAGEPEPKTTCVRVWESGQRVHSATPSRKAASSAWLLSASMAAAATRSTAAAAAGARPGGAAQRRLLAGAVRREDRELPLRLRRPAVGAGGGLVTADELLEVRLAAHADVLVDRHRGSAYQRRRGSHRRESCARRRTERMLRVARYPH